MNKRNIVLGAALAGIIAAGTVVNSSVAHAEDHAAADKNSCKGKDKNSCKGAKKAATKDEKNSCGGKNGCGAKAEDKKQEEKK